MSKQIKKNQAGYNSGVQNMSPEGVEKGITWIDAVYLLPLILPLIDKVHALVSDLSHDAMEHRYKMEFSCGSMKLSFEPPEQVNNKTTEQK